MLRPSSTTSAAFLNRRAPIRRKSRKKLSQIKTGMNLLIPSTQVRFKFSSDYSDSTPPGALHLLSPLRCWGHSEPSPDSFAFVPERRRSHASWRESLPATVLPQDGDARYPC